MADDHRDRDLGLERQAYFVGARGEEFLVEPGEFGIEEALVPLANQEAEVLHLLAGGDHVVMHSRRRVPGGPEITVVDIARFEDGLIVEVWETIEPLSEARAHLTWWDAAN